MSEAAANFEAPALRPGAINPYRKRVARRSELAAGLGLGENKAIIPASLQADPRYQALRPAARDTIQAILAFTDGHTGIAEPGVATIAALAGRHPRTVGRATVEIEAAGLFVKENRLARRRNWKRDGWLPNLYRFCLSQWAELDPTPEQLAKAEAELARVRALEAERRALEEAARAAALELVARRTRARAEWDGLVELSRHQLDALAWISGELDRTPIPTPLVRSTIFRSAAEELGRQERARLEESLFHADSRVRRLLGFAHDPEPMGDIERALKEARSVCRYVEGTLRNASDALQRTVAVLAVPATQTAQTAQTDAAPQQPVPGLSEAKLAALKTQRAQLERVIGATRDFATRTRLEAALRRTLEQLGEAPSTGPPGRR